MIPLFKVGMSADAAPAVAKVLSSGFIGEGEQVACFEEELQEALAPAGMEAVLTGSCTDAIHMVLSHLGVGPGDEVITTPMTCVATNAPILARGAKIVWADVEMDGNISPMSVLRYLTERTKAIIVVNWTGHPVEVNSIRRMLPRSIPIIQDIAHGPDVRGNDSYGHGDYLCMSFGPIKHLTSGDGGAVLCSPQQAKALRILRWYGLDRSSSKDFRCEQNIWVPGLKWHMNDINAAIGRQNLKDLSVRIGVHKQNARYLCKAIKSEYVSVPEYSPQSNYWVFPLRVKANRYKRYVGPLRRDLMQKHLSEQGVASSQVHAPNNEHTAYMVPKLSPLSTLSTFRMEQLNIPCGWWVTPEMAIRIAEAVNCYKEPADG